MTTLPDLITHNFDPAFGPFGNICASGVEAAHRTVATMALSGRRHMKANYLDRRLATEAWLAAAARAKLGRTKRPFPVYFFLGDFADGADPSRPHSIRIPLSKVDMTQVTFTYPDSMASFWLGHREDLADERQPYHGHVFTFAEIRAVVSQHGLPGDRWRSDARRRWDRFVEVQLWDDAAILALKTSWYADPQRR